MKYIIPLSIALGFNIFLSDIAKAENEKKNIVIMGTTDIHGNIFPVNYFNGKVQNFGLAKVYTKVKEIRKNNTNTLLVDSGDLLQGTPLTDYYGKKEKSAINPMIKAMNIMKYDALGIGNHEYDYGIDNLLKAVKNAKFSMLSANTYYHKEDKPVFKPYIIKNISDVKVGIIGFTTPGVAVWSKNIVDKRYEFKDIVQAAKKWIPELKKQVDIIVAVPHSGLEDIKGMGGYDSSSGLPPENVGKALAQNFSQIDVLLLGHTHTEIKEMIENGVLISQADKYGDMISIVNLDLEKVDNKWKIVKKNSETFNVKDTPPDKELMDELSKEHENTLKYVNSTIGYSDKELNAKLSRLQDSEIVDLINYVQMETTGSDISAAALFNEDAVIPKGKVSIANVAALYLYENTLSSIKVTGKQLKEYLEMTSMYYEGFDESGNLIINKKMPGYNYDMFSGIDYKINVNNPQGSRITFLKFKGKDIKDSDTFKLALNSYRQSGGGGYDMLKGSPILYSKGESIRDLIINYIQKTGEISDKNFFKKNWEVVKE